MADALTVTDGRDLTEWVRQAGGGPAWLASVRDEAKAVFQRDGLPSTRHEEWRYTPVRDLGDLTYQPAPSFATDESDLGPLGELTAIARLVFANGQFDPSLSSMPQIEGLDIARLSEVEDELWVREHLGQLAKPEQNPFVALNTALFGDAVVVRVRRDTTIEAPLHVHYVNRAGHDGPFVSVPRILILVEMGAQLTVLESHRGEGVYLSCPVVEVVVEANARLEHTKVQDESVEAYHIATIEGRQERDSVYTSNNVAYGAALGRTDVNFYLGGEHVECWLNGVYVGLGDQLLDNHTRLDHAMPNGNSFEVYKGILGGRSRGVFNGKIFVHQDAQKTDAKQTNQAILLSPTATIDTKPQLEIFADDVKCTHGATVGQIGQEEMFYLRARGIPAKMAEALLTYAFASEVLDRIGDPGIRDVVERRLYEKLGGGFPV